jgi:mRNA interferase RelE/StbE
MYNVRVSAQVEAAARTLAPTPRRAVRAALAGLAHERGDLKALEGTLAGFWRLRVGRHRVVFCYVAPRTIDCLFLEERNVVYEIFSTLLRDGRVRG